MDAHQRSAPHKIAKVAQYKRKRRLDFSVAVHTLPLEADGLKVSPPTRHSSGDLAPNRHGLRCPCHDLRAPLRICNRIIRWADKAPGFCPLFVSEISAEPEPLSSVIHALAKPLTLPPRRRCRSRLQRSGE